MRSAPSLALVLLAAAPPLLAQLAPPTCNTGCAPCPDPLLCGGGCGPILPIQHPLSQPCNLGGGFDLTATEFAATCYSGSGGCPVSVPPVRFWGFDQYATANYGCQKLLVNDWLANPPLDLGAPGPLGHWVLWQASWNSRYIDGCPAASRRTLVELTFPDSRLEGTPSHQGWYLLASVDENGAYDFDRIRGGTGCNPADVPALPVPGVRVVGASGPCVANPSPSQGRAHAGDCHFMDVDLDLVEPSPGWYTETGYQGTPPHISGYQILYARGAGPAGEPTTSAACAGTWRPVLDPADPTRASGVVPVGSNRVTVTVPTPLQLDERVWFATRIVYRDSTLNPTGSFDPATQAGPWIVSAISSHCGPVNLPLPLYIAYSNFLKDDAVARSTNVDPGDPIAYTISFDYSGFAEDGRNVHVTDVLPKDCLDLSGFDPARDVSVSPASATVTYDAVNAILDISFDLGPAPGPNTITIGGLRAGATPGDCCNQATLRNDGCVQPSLATADPEGAAPTCTRIGAPLPCSPEPERVLRLRAARSSAHVRFEWDAAGDPTTDHYNLWKVVDRDKSKVPGANQRYVGPEVAAVAGCAAVPRAAPLCIELGAVPAAPSLVYYQARGACASGFEGTSHPF